MNNGDAVIISCRIQQAEAGLHQYIEAHSEEMKKLVEQAFLGFDFEGAVKQEVKARLAEVERLKAAGLTVREACRQVGVTRNQYYYNYKNPERVSVFVSNGL